MCQSWLCVVFESDQCVKMSDNEGGQDVSCNDDSDVCNLSTTSNRSVTYSPQHVETGSKQDVEDNSEIPPPTYEESVRMMQEKKNASNINTRGRSANAGQSIEIVTIDENTTRSHMNAPPPCESPPPVFNETSNNIQTNDIPLQCLECLRSELNYRQNQAELEQDTPKKRGVCAPLFQHIFCRMAILTVFFVLLSFLCFINIYLFIFIFVSIVVVIFVNLGGGDEQFEE